MIGTEEESKNQSKVPLWKAFLMDILLLLTGLGKCLSEQHHAQLEISFLKLWWTGFSRYPVSASDTWKHTHLAMI